MNNQSQPENPLANVVGKLISIIVSLIVAIFGLDKQVTESIKKRH